MRQIRFRGKRVGTGQWVHGFLSDHNTIKLMLGENEFDVIPETIGQFTGLTDKNEIDIYEGDVLRFGKKAIKCVWTHNGFYAINLDGSPHSTNMGDDYYFSVIWNQHTEITGNIHDK